MKETKFEQEYDERVKELYMHRKQVTELAMKHLPADKINDFLEAEDKMFNNALTGILWKLDNN